MKFLTILLVLLSSFCFVGCDSSKNQNGVEIIGDAPEPGECIEPGNYLVFYEELGGNCDFGNDVWNVCLGEHCQKTEDRCTGSIFYYNDGCSFDVDTICETEDDFTIKTGASLSFVKGRNHGSGILTLDIMDNQYGDVCYTTGRVTYDKAQ